MSNSTKQEDLVIPIYLDTNILLDLLASIEDGFSVVDKVTTKSLDSKSTELSGGGEFGISGVFNIFKINLGGTAKKGKNAETGQESQTERYHTYGSLLNKLRQTLKNEKMLREITDEETFQNVNISDFIEVRGTFVPNPWRDTIKTINGLLDLIINLSSELGQIIPPEQKDQIPIIKRLLENILKDLEHESMQTFIIESIKNPKNKIVVSLFSEYIRDRSGRELPYGEFRLLGKVMRKIEGEDTINLLKGSSISALSSIQTQEFSKIFTGLGKNLQIPEVITEVKAPAIQVIPIAVFI